MNARAVVVVLDDPRQVEAWNTRATLSPPLPSPEVALVRDSFDPNGDGDGGELLVRPGQTAQTAGHYEARDNFEPFETADGKPQRFIGGCVVEGGQEVVFTYEPGMAAHVARLLNAALSTSLPSPLGVERRELVARAIADCGHIDLSVMIAEYGGIVAGVAAAPEGRQYRLPTARGVLAYADAALSALPLLEDRP